MAEENIKTNSPICDRCLRLVYISFNFVPNYISTYCLYCKKILVYSYNNFYQIIKEKNNPVLFCKCKKCKKLNSFSKDGNPLYLIEKKNDIFYIICENCLENEKDERYVRKILVNELMNHSLDFYVRDIRYTKLKELDKHSQKINNEIDYYLKIFENLKDNIFIIELIIKELPTTLWKKAREKIKNIKLDIEIKKMIIDYNNQFSNFITVNNKLSVLYSIYDFSGLKLKSKINILYRDLYELINKFMKEEKYYIIPNFEKEKNFCDYSLLTKIYNNKEDFIKDKNEPKELILNDNYKNVLNINFQKGKTLIYNIYADKCLAEKIVPVCYNFYEKEQNIEYQNILLYNYKNDRKLYYGTYDTSLNKLEENSLSVLINENYENIFKILLINNGEDLFIMGKSPEDEKKTDVYFIENFREKEKKNYKKYDINNITNFELISNQTIICIKTEKKISLISKNNLKEFSLPEDIISYTNFNNILNNNANNINNNGFINNNFYNNQNNNNPNDYNYNNNINNSSFNNMSNNFNNNNMNNNNFNNFNTNFINNNMNNNNMNNNNYYYNNFNYIYNNFNNNYNVNDNNFNYINNNLNMNNFNNMTNINNFLIEEQAIKFFYRSIIDINNNDYFVVFSSKHIIKMNNSKDIYYLSLFNYNTMEEVTKIEINNLSGIHIIYEFVFKKEENHIILQANSSIYTFIFEEGELRQI